MAVKLDYSRLLDDEFLNRKDHDRVRVRVRAVTSGASQVLESSGDSWDLRKKVRAMQCAVFIGMAVGFMFILYLFLTAIVVNLQHQPLHLEALFGSGSSAPAAAALVRANDSVAERSLHSSLWGRLAAVNSTGLAISTGPGEGEALLQAVRARGQLHDHVQDHDHGHPVLEDDAHLLAMTGHHEPDNDDDDHQGHADGEHVHPGDVILGDHHVVPAGDAGPTEHALLFCLPLTTTKHTASGSTLTSSAGSAPEARSANLSLTRSQRDVVHSVAEFLSGTAQCHVVVLRGVDDGEASSTPSAPVENKATDSIEAARPSLPGYFGHTTGCGWSGDGDGGDDTAGAEAGGSLPLPSGRSLPVVNWDATQLFARSPLAAVWHSLRRVRDVPADTASDSGSDLLDLASRLLLLWRFGGITVNLHASADQVLKTLSAFNRTDSQHTYLETTGSTLIAAPQTCNAIVFDLIRAVKKTQTVGTAAKEEHGHSGDVRVFDGVLDDYCRGAPRKTRSVSRDEERKHLADKVDLAASSDSTESSEVSETSASAEDNSVPADEKVRRGHMSFRMLRSGRPSTTTTTPGPEPQHILIDTTRCRNNLVAISLV